MPEIPPEAVQRAAEVLFRQYEREYSAGQHAWRDFTEPAREVLDAAAPVFAEAVARKILAHMDEHQPPADVILEDDGESVSWLTRNRWRRHFGIAARIAAGAFTTEAESKQQGGSGVGSR